MADPSGNVNSNYGWQWKRNDQIDYVIDEEEIANQGHDLDMSKWEWMKTRQLHKLKACNELMKKLIGIKNTG